MKPNRFILLLSLFAFPFLGQAQSGAGNFTSIAKRDPNIYVLSAEKADIQLEFCTPDMVRIRTSWDRKFEKNEVYMVTKYDWDPVKVTTKEEADRYLFETAKLSIRINKSPFRIEIANQEGDILSSEELAGNAGGAYQKQEVVGSKKRLMPGEHFFGFGERMDFVDQRGKKLSMNVGRGEGMPHIVGAYNILEANYAPIPFLMSTRGYGVFLHNPYASHWDLGHTHNEVYSFEAEGGELDYYFIYGPDFPSILHHYTNLSGKSPLLPRFAHGLHVGTYSGGTWGHEEQTSTQYVVELARKFREKGIPVDIFHLDSTWRLFGENGGKGATTFEWRETFKNPKVMFDSLYALNLNMVGLHIRPRFDNGKKLNLLEQARKKGYVYPEEDNPGEFVNVFDEEAVDWWWEHGAMRVAELGAMFFKTDEGSAFGRKANESDKVGPTGEDAQRLHNIFPVAYAKAPFERFSKYNNMRGMNHTREGYAGIQRYPLIWAGDWPSEWQYFAPVIRAGINMGLSGVGYWSHNMGGFEHNADPELYIRWVQFGMFSPVAHVFGMDHPGYKEPWNYGKEAEKIFTQYDKLRYRLIPYIYSNAFEQHQTGMPLMRALVLENQHDENTYQIDDQYLFGNSIMVCPVTTKGAQTRVVYLPEGKWYDYWTGTPYEGKQYYNIVTPLDKLPLFVKAGAIIPMQEEIQYDNRQDWGDLTLEIFPGEKNEFKLFEDDGISKSYEEGRYSITPVNTEFSVEGSAVMIGKAEGEYPVPERNYMLKMHMHKAPVAVQRSLNGKRQKTVKSIDAQEFAKKGGEGWYYDEEAELLWVKANKAGGESLRFTVSH
jgi:alpha-glucosidase